MIIKIWSDVAMLFCCAVEVEVDAVGLLVVVVDAVGLLIVVVFGFIFFSVVYWIELDKYCHGTN